MQSDKLWKMSFMKHNAVKTFTDAKMNQLEKCKIVSDMMIIYLTESIITPRINKMATFIGKTNSVHIRLHNKYQISDQYAN